MKITVIGMWGGFPKKGEPCSGYLIQHEGFSLLVDCGSGVLMKLQEFINLNEIHHVVLSHYHYDHSSDVGAYQFSRLVNTKLGKVDHPLCIYGPENPVKKDEFTSIPYTQFQRIDQDTELTIGPFQLNFLKSIHPVETYAMKITCKNQTIVYTADTSYFEELAVFSKGADLLIAECSLYEGMDGKSFGHMNAREAGLLAAKAEAKQTILTHLPHYGNLQELLQSAQEVGGMAIDLAKPGMTVKF
ncbi:MBL fold metallo-hydrolase [Oceanobacillus luteolus]|uniref:MBL fold metallo-hydrolase n=1 Tax=Oceanobacillus luteolus TaxID=1274358 RepID=UPI00203FD3E9|nr:MBL fold metallo-hydrolase [Oceanobacillus luteolus]MCM3741709.1 MBL fold metallo-hydrolase [Oceanobacillus luteolus]